MSGPTEQLVAQLAGAWRQVARAREQDGQVAAATAAEAAAHATHRVAAVGIYLAGRSRHTGLSRDAGHDHGRG